MGARDQRPIVVTRPDLERLPEASVRSRRVTES